MTRLTHRSTDDMSEAQRAQFEQLAQGRKLMPDGGLGGPFDALTLNAEMGRRIVALGDTLRFRTELDRRFVELAILVTGQFWQAQFEWWAHEPMARDAGVPENVIQSIKAGEQPEFTDLRDAACYEFCTAMHRDHQVTDATYEAALGHFGEQALTELIGTSGLYTMVSMTLNTFQVGLPKGAEPPFPG